MKIKYVPSEWGWIFSEGNQYLEDEYDPKYLTFRFQPLKFIKHVIQKYAPTPPQTRGGSKPKKPRTSRKSNPAPSKD